MRKQHITEKGVKDWREYKKTHYIIKKEDNIMKKQDAIKLILEYYNELKEDLRWQLNQVYNNNSDWLEGQLCAIRYILINVYGFKDNDERF